MVAAKQHAASDRRLPSPSVALNLLFDAKFDAVDRTDTTSAGVRLGMIPYVGHVRMLMA